MLTSSLVLFILSSIMMLFAKILSYAYNAYLDAQIAEEIIIYIKSGGKSFATKKTVAQQRAEKLVATVGSNGLKIDPSYAIGLAYTQYHLNGLADILYINLLWPLYISRQKTHMRKLYKESTTRFRAQFPTKYQYEEIIHQTGISLWYWPLVVANPWRWAQQFAKERCGYIGTLDRDALRKASLEVQRQNIQNNHQVAQAIIHRTQSLDPKVTEIRKVSDKVHNPPHFLSEAATTQEAAAKWDKLFVWLINR